MLYTKGISYNSNGVQMTKRVKVLVGISDSVERPVLRCSTQFNGKYRCGLCLHPGIEVPKGDGRVRVYPRKNNNVLIPAPARTHQETLQHALNKEYGMKDITYLCHIQGFDIIDGLDLDWPHAVLYGVCRQFAKLMFESKHRERNFSISRKLKQVDAFLLSIKPSLEVSRTPRKMSDYKHWKMHEWAIWLLFYSLPTLKLFHDHKEYVNHWALLVDGISILSQRSIMKSEVLYAEQCLVDFVDQVPVLYGMEEVSFNVHLLTHLPQSVKNFSCLWTHSSFLYEDFYQDLLSFVKSSQGVAVQMCESMRMRWVVKNLLNVCADYLDEKQKEFLEGVLNRKLRSSPALRVAGACLLGSGTPVQLKNDEFIALQRINIPVERGSPVVHYDRAIIDGELVHSENYTRVTKRNSYVVLLKDGNVFKVKRFLVVSRDDYSECFAVGQYYVKRRGTFLSNRKLSHIICVNEDMNAQMSAVRLCEVEEKLTYFDVPGLGFSLACMHPNHVEFLV